MAETQTTDALVGPTFRWVIGGLLGLIAMGIYALVFVLFTNISELEERACNAQREIGYIEGRMDALSEARKAR